MNGNALLRLDSKRPSAIKDCMHDSNMVLIKLIQQNGDGYGVIISAQWAWQKSGEIYV